MDVFDTIKDRRGIRTYKDVGIPKDRLENLLEATRLAPFLELFSRIGNWGISKRRK
jgi:Nitroreductase